MGTHYNSKVVTDGLAFMLDAINSKSYTGSGSQWHDMLSSNYVNMFNSPTYTGDAFEFTYSPNSYFISAQNWSTFGMGSSMTISVWASINAHYGIYGGTLLRCESYLNDGFRFRVRSNGSLRLWADQNGGTLNLSSAAPAGTVPADGTPFNAAFTYNSSTQIGTTYYNGEVVLSGSGTLIEPATRNLIHGSIEDSSDCDFKTFSMSGYNRALTGDEIKYNFNMMRGRFGI